MQSCRLNRLRRPDKQIFSAAKKEACVHAEASSSAPQGTLAFPPALAPMLLTVVHTEEEFDWSKPFNRDAIAISHVRELGRAQELFDRCGARPIYVVDYPIASQDLGISTLRALAGNGSAAIGAHLHPWVNPPFTEEVSTYHSYPGNLPSALEAQKLQQLTDRIADGFGARPTVYLAGRYGFGPHTLSILQELGYRIDLSAVAMSDFRSDGGPDYRRRDNSCRWEGDPAILRIPHSVADVGFLCRDGQRLFEPGASATVRALRLPGILARCGAIEHVRLSPEGFSLRHLKSAARALIAAGVKVLVFSFHSPSIAPGFTPYVRDRSDLAEFVGRIEGFLRFFKDELGGVFANPERVLEIAA
jgi:hypothetical protein